MSNIKDEIKKLRDSGVDVWSYSRLSTANQCLFEYYKSYVLREKGKQNVYGHIGGITHDFVEGIYLNEKKIEDFKSTFNSAIVEGELLGIDFPSETIKESFLRDMRHYIDNFKKLDGKFLTEQQFLFKIGEHWIQGFIDLIRVYQDNQGNKNIEVTDWKTSSKFTGDKLKESGRQLVMYKVALEDLTKHKVSEVRWCMLKYIYVCHKQKNGKINRKMVNRGKLIKEMKVNFTKLLKENGYDDLEIDIYLDTASKTNSIKGLPDCITDKYWLEDCYLAYEVTDEVVQELHDYVNSTIEMINGKDKSKPDEWTPIITIDEKQSFYCNVLCGFRDTCSARKEYIEKNNLNKKNNNSFGGFY